MKRKILFIISCLGEGGVSKSIVNLLNLIDRDKYNISLLVCSGSKGLLDPLVPNWIKIIRNKRIALLYAGTAGLWPLLKEGAVKAFFGSLWRLILASVSKSAAALQLAYIMPPVEGEFDVIVDYNGQQQLYYMIDKLNAKKKYTFFHSDYAKWPYYYKSDRKYMPKADGIFTISETCALSLKKFFPNEALKIGIIPNLSSPELISQLASEPADEMDVDIIKLISVGHISHLKGSDMALKAARLLKDSGISFRWFFIGKDSGDIDYHAEAHRLGIAENIVFLGLKRNPYAYISKADIFVHTSLFEGRSIALDEAKILAKPVVVTKFTTVHDQFKHRHNATISEMTPEAIACAIKELIENDGLRAHYINTLRAEKYDNATHLKKIYSLLD